MTGLEKLISFLILIGRPWVKLVEIILGIGKKIRLPKRQKKQKEKRFKKRQGVKIKWGRYLFLVLLLGLISFSYLFYDKIWKELPDVNLIYNPPKMSTIITDRKGEILYKFYQDENRTWIPLDKIPEDLKEATIAIEDKDFYGHYGLSVKGVIKALIYNFKKDGEDKPRGGSTITQQLVKNVFLSDEKTLTRKVKEAILTLMIEKKLSKNEILERYLNQVSYGGEAYGVAEASWKYFGKQVGELNTIEAAYLAGLPAAPSSYSPYGNNPNLGLLRAKHVIEEMVSNGYLNSAEAERWLGQKINIKTNNKEIKAPHFVFMVKQWLEEKYGYTNLEKQGLTIKTTLDLKVQREAQKMVTEEVKSINKLNITNGAALILDVRLGDILAMVGSKDYQATDIDGKFNVTTGLRQPGSSIKPINYLLALEKGYSLASIIDDSPITYQIKGQKPYSPQNYNGKYMGRVTLRTALASSLNIPSVKLLEKNGVSNMIDLAEKMGIKTWKERNRFGLSLALGAGEVKMTELAQAYSIFANLGDKVEINPILEIKNYLGETIYKKEIEKEKIVEPEYAYMINDALSDNQARSPIFGSNSKLVIKDKTVAVKTGTTNSLKDNWCIGWTPSYLVATWVGNNDGRPMSWVASGVTGATPIWNKIMTELLKNKDNEIWQKPDSLIKKNICGRDEWMVNGSEIKVDCLKTTPTTTLN
jgi:1A family penicillin-binding protein